MTRFPIRRIALLLVLGFFAAFVDPAASGESKGQAKKTVTVEGITEYQLDNGVRFLLFPDPSSSTVTINLTVLVGSRHEGYGETGMAHLLEHMLFKGSLKFPLPDKLLTARGADYNGTTWVDRTNYYETMPASDDNLEFGIRLEADRLVNCFIKREDLAKEMTVVRNEFEIGENDPEGILSQRMMAIAYEWHNYGKSTIGNRADIERVPIDRLHDFYKKYYQPDNIVLAVAGKFDEKKAVDLITAHFGAIPRPKRKLELTYTEEPAQDGERTVTLRRVGKFAVAAVMYHIPAAAHEDFAPLEVLEDILTNAPSGRLYKALVDSKKATQVSGSASTWHDPGLIEIAARVSDKVAPEEVRDILLQQIETIAANPVSAEEVERSKQRLKAIRERAMTKSKSMCIELSEWAGTGDWRLLFVHRDRVAQVKSDDVSRVARKYLTKNNRTVGLFLPTDQAARATIPAGPPVLDLVKDYKGGKGIAMGEVFDPTPANIENRVKRVQLASGVQAALLPKKTRGETVVGRLVLHFGNDQSLKGYTTACNFLGPLMMRGTEKSTRQQIQDRIDKLEAKLNASSRPGELTFAWEAKRATLPAVLDLLGEILRSPAFPDKEFDVLKRNQKQSIEKMMADPQGQAFQTLMRKLHPYAKDDIRYVPSFEEALVRLEKTTREHVARLYAEQVGGDAGELALVGDFDEAAAKQVEGMLANWKAKAAYKRIEQTANVKIAGSREQILTPDKDNAVYVAGLTLPVKDTDKDYAALELGNYLLGGSTTSRLFDRLREKEGLSYGAGSQLNSDARDPYSLFVIYAFCNPENIDKADTTALEEVRKLLKEGVSADELARGQKAYLQELKVSFASDGMLAKILREGLEVGRTFQYYANLEKQVTALSLQDVNQTLRERLAPDRLVIIRAGDFNKKVETK